MLTRRYFDHSFVPRGKQPYSTFNKETISALFWLAATKHAFEYAEGQPALQKLIKTQERKEGKTCRSKQTTTASLPANGNKLKPKHYFKVLHCLLSLWGHGSTLGVSPLPNTSISASDTCDVDGGVSCRVEVSSGCYTSWILGWTHTGHGQGKSNQS